MTSFEFVFSLFSILLGLALIAYGARYALMGQESDRRPTAVRLGSVNLGR